MRPFPPLAVLLALGSATASAQQVWLVAKDGSGDFTTPQAAVDVALQRDTILIRPGIYPGFTVVNKALQIVADPPGTVAIQAGIDVMALAPGRDVYLAGIDAMVVVGGSSSPCKGVPLIENCSAHADGSTHDDAVGVFGDVRAVAVVGADLVGFTQPDFPASIDGGDGIRQYDFLKASTHVLVYHSTLTGGDGSDGYSIFCTDAGRGGDGVEAYSGIVHSANNQITPGLGGDGCPDGPDGQEYHVWGTATHFPSTAPLSRLRVPDVVREGEAVEFTVEGTPGHKVWIVESEVLQSRFLGGYVGDLALASPLTVVPVGTIPAGGILKVPYTVPDLPPGVETDRIFRQALLGDGASRYLSNPSGMVILDSSF